MGKRIGRTAIECFFDLGATVIYAAIVGLLIVAIVASDRGPASLVKVALYASLLPVAVVAMIILDLVLRVVSDSRAARRHPRAPMGARHS